MTNKTELDEICKRKCKLLYRLTCGHAILFTRIYKLENIDIGFLWRKRAVPRLMLHGPLGGGREN